MTARSGSWFSRFTRRLLVWLLLAAALWWIATPSYNRFLAEAAENLARLTEDPNVTRLRPYDRNRAIVERIDRRVPGLPYSIRLTDIHFNVVLLAALFLAVPDVAWRRRLGALGSALIFLACFHLVDLYFWIEFVYATQLGDWSTEHYDAWARNFWGLGKHVLDLPVKLGLPLLLWCVHFLDEVRAEPAA